ncbi:hypothetical protein QFC19_001025 [Naganishia cerealis]|uniref:Uncharacterized protein n=1 Tax=Naganishia cerealis TaxID=610337 RepID=A0ACC2WJR3_9TREE|nr:hypothetical protein QFC19_001025 [Naganishia cerealis]
MAGPGKLAAFLQNQRTAFLQDLHDGRAQGWVVAMGNEAGDLDSLASSIAYATLSSTLDPPHRSLPLLLTPKKYMTLRPENILALTAAGIPTQKSAGGAEADEIFLHLEDLPVDASELAERGIKFALVDHNTLLPPFRNPNAEGTGQEETEDPVVAIIDHHANDGNHNHASPRIIQIPTGSTTSLVTTYFKAKWEQAIQQSGNATLEPPPTELATLLLSGILIDTGALKAGDNVKTTDTDREAAEFLWRVSSPQVTSMYASDSTTTNGSTGMTLESLQAGLIAPELSAFANSLFEAKNDVSSLSTHELLLRDYKEYTMHTAAAAAAAAATASSGESLTVGLSTVPMGLSLWLTRDAPHNGLVPGWQNFVAAMDEWMVERGLDIAGVLTSFNDPPKVPSGAATNVGKGKHRRELVFIVRARPQQQQPAVAAVASGEPSPAVTRAEQIAQTLIQGISNAGPILDAQVWKPGKPFEKNEALVQGLKDELMMDPQDARKVGRFGCVWRQGNAASTRKQVAPLIVSSRPLRFSLPSWIPSP